MIRQNIAQLEDLFIITSTHGEGEPPDNAWDFFEFLEDDNAPEFKSCEIFSTSFR